MLCEDRESALDAWFTRRADGLPDLIAAGFRFWFEALRDGSRIPPRLRPRSAATIRVHVARAAPILHAWASAGHQSLREITRQDILAALPAQANQRRQALTALQSLFRFLKGRRVIFADPAARLRHDRLHNGQPLPMNLDTVRAAIHSGQPARAALAALVAFHALRSGQLASLELTDVRDGRLHLDGRVIPLAGPVRERLAAWLDDRARRWPATVNPHLFINWYTAVRESRVSSPGSATPSASPRRPSARTASCTRPWPPAATSAASATCSASPSAAPSATPAPQPGHDAQSPVLSPAGEPGRTLPAIPRTKSAQAA
jgi:integrase